MRTILINPMDEAIRVRGNPAPRLDTLAGKTIGLLDISKPGGNVFLDRLEHLLRERLSRLRVCRATDLADIPDGSRVRVAGLVTHRQRPETASGVLFERRVR